jgi:hypothetical protein
VAAPARPVIGLFGDGAAMFSIQELITATELRLALPIVIVDNGGYAEIRQQMVERDIVPQAVDLHRPDIPALARAIGAYGLAATTVDDVAEMASQAPHRRPSDRHLLRGRIGRRAHSTRRPAAHISRRSWSCGWSKSGANPAASRKKATTTPRSAGEYERRAVVDQTRTGSCWPTADGAAARR